MRTKYIALTFLVIGFAAGFAVPRKYAQRPVSDAASFESPDHRPSLMRKDRSLSATGGFENSSSAPIGELLDKAFSEPSEYRGTRYLITALARHSKATAGQFAAYFTATRFSRSQIQHWRLFFSSWGTFDGPGALAYIKKRFDEPTLQREFIFSVLKSWDKEASDSELEETGDFLVAIPGTTGDLAKEYIRNLMLQDRNKGVREMVRLTDPEAVMEMAGNQLMALAKSNLNSALERLGQADGEAKSYLTDQLLNAWSSFDPAAAANWLTGQGYPNISSGDLNALVGNYMKLNPNAAFEWINRLPDTHFNASLLHQAADKWAKVDPSATKTWLSHHQPAPEYDPVVIAIVQNEATTSPASALEAASSLIHDPAKSQETFFSLAMEWKSKQPAEFTRWLKETTLVSSEQKQRLFNREFHADAETQAPISPRQGAQPANGREIQ